MESNMNIEQQTELLREAAVTAEEEEKESVQEKEPQVEFF